ncbi:PAS domain S-box protein [Pseudoduganella plicata]|uniref:histidine kinase n=1 Tax=Pseudoduganella plicata TaxID=321984 RepID=A0A4P7BG21_9BURK|nr:PAS domain S-box protein [Pseudoduganella plicata]QBQ36379.1 PAS domain-containing sensor histidine kinase [Pseudoduganella plicata]GGY75690.1 hypothetical protein GCM10007388_05280 [Pseudoduganella plicata]
MADPFHEHCFSRMVEKVSDYAIFLLDTAGIIQTWNPAAQAMKGYPAHEAIGQPLAMLYTEADRQRDHPRHNLEDATRNGTFQESAWRQRKDGSLFWALVEVIAIRGDDGRLEGFCKMTRDLTNLKDLQDRLAREKERAELTLNAIAVGVISVDDAGLVEYVNDQAQHFMGWSREDARGLRTEQVFDIVPPGEYSADEARLAREEIKGTPPRSTRILRARDGTRHVVETRQSAIPGRDGMAGGTVIVFHDVGERQGMEAALRDADRRKDEFLAMLAHELRNPLAPVSAAAELLSLGKFDATAARKASQVIIRQVRHMTALIDDLLDVSRVSRGQVTLQLASLDMKAVVSCAIEQVRPLIESRQHTLAITLAPALAHVKGDEKRLIQVIANLLNNAAKYTPPGGAISVAMSVADGVVCIEVADNGIGIDPAAQQFVFDLFEQVHTTSDRAMGGLGIGLALARSIVHLHDGAIGCESAGLGHGSCFRVCLPRLAQDQTTPERRVADRLVEVPHAPVRLSVLLVDDNVDAAEMLKFFLTAAGHRVTLAHTAGAALDAVRSSIPDACVLDIGLPDGSGHDLAVDIRNVANPPPVLIALSGFGTARDRTLANEAGFDHYFVKPVELEAFARVFGGIRPRRIPPRAAD